MLKTLSQCKHGHFDLDLKLDALSHGYNAVIKRTCAVCNDPLIAVLSYPV